MRYRLEILVVGRSREQLLMLQDLLGRQGDVNVRIRHVGNGHTDPLYEVDPLPDALVLVLSENWHAELSALMERRATERPPLLVVGHDGNVDLIREAMRAGARDFFTPPISESELTQSLQKLMRDRMAEASRHTAHLTAVINAKGGSGASMIAANIAHLLAVTASDRRTALMDMDLQFGALPLYFNMTPRNGMVRALESVDSLDTMALEGYVQPHQSGLDLLASAPDELVSVADVPESRVELLLQVMSEAYDDIVVDLPRWIGGSTAMVLERADRVLVVLQQGVAHLRDAKRLIGILRQEIHISGPRIIIVVNRYDKRNAVSLRDIQDALPDQDIVTLPNDFRQVTQSINIGSPLPEHAARAPVTRELAKLSRRLHEDRPGDDGRKSGGWSLFGLGRRS
ncbi:AAA family ATPase [Thioalkalivibrio thiocyanodenitrificans]|uniref:AAA family ATPase n=1 Tax=Thioalkalivibrio thiocyanodenitrificans TaxID=243063 RepID=UPI0012EAB428|nr:AAA family ATPase [Thioalkalivibrio thiocyanodenitrificans]